jgi:hypothetical protein
MIVFSLLKVQGAIIVGLIFLLSYVNSNSFIPPSQVFRINEFDSLNPPVNPKNFVSYFAICAVIKDELDLHEWVTYHYRMGCGKFYLFNNGNLSIFEEDPSISNPFSITNQLSDYLKSGVVELQDVAAMLAPQLHVYHRCIRNYRRFHQFIGFIDADEFIVIPSSPLYTASSRVRVRGSRLKNKGLNNKESKQAVVSRRLSLPSPVSSTAASSIRQSPDCNLSIPVVLKRYEDYGAVTLNWMLFGSSGHIKRPVGGVLANYYKCCRYNHIKTIVNTNYAVSHYGNPHQFHYSHGKYAVDTKFRVVKNHTNSPQAPVYRVMYINHYHLKSKEDYDRIRLRGRASTTEASNKTEDYFYYTDNKMKKDCPLLTIPAYSCSIFA